MFAAAAGTCDAVSLDDCAQARARASNCDVEFDYGSATDPLEIARLMNEWSACKSASKVDSCQ